MVDVAKRLCTDSQHSGRRDPHATTGSATRCASCRSTRHRLTDARPRANRRRSRAGSEAAPRRRSRRPQAGAKPSRGKPGQENQASRLNANSFAISAVHPRQARVRNNLARPRRSPPGAVAAAHSLLVPHAAGRARSDVPRSTKTPSAGSRSTTPTSSSTGRRFSKRKPRLRRRPTTREIAAAGATRRRRDLPRQPVAAQPRPAAAQRLRRNRPGTGTSGTAGTLNWNRPGTGTLEPEAPWNRNPEARASSKRSSNSRIPTPKRRSNRRRARRAGVRARAADAPARAVCGAAGAHRRARRRPERIEALRAQAEPLNPGYLGHRRGRSAKGSRRSSRRSAICARRSGCAAGGDHAAEAGDAEAADGRSAAAGRRARVAYALPSADYRQLYWTSRVFTMKKAALRPGLSRAFWPLSRFGGMPASPAAASRTGAAAARADAPTSARPSGPRSTSSAPTSSSGTVAGSFRRTSPRDDFEVYEDGVKQELTSFMLVHGGRVYQRSGRCGAGTRGHHPSAIAAGERRCGPHHPLRRRRSAPRIPRHPPRTPAVPRHGERARPRRRSVRHRLDRHVVDRDRPHLRPCAHGGSGQQDYRRGLEAVRDHPAVRRRARHRRKSCTARTSRSRPCTRC